ncbi:MAG: hypothetical protein V3T31_09240 [candidate division Zixibacteria bacterium]
MNFDKWNQWLSLLANFGVVIGIIFLALEVRTNTATNRIAIQAAFSANWVEINGDIAGNRDLAAVIEKAIAGEELDRVESRQFRHYIRQYASQGGLMRHLYVEGLASKEDVRRGYRALSSYAKYDRFRQEIEELDTAGSMILEEDGFEKWFEEQN